MNTFGDAPPPSQPDPVPDAVTEGHAAFQEAAPLAEFTLDFAKAMLRTGYYAPDHPEAQASREGLYEEFVRVLEDRTGLTYLIGMDGQRRTVMIDGYDSGALVLDKIMVRGMAQLFTPKLLEFFERRHLLSFSLRAGIAVEEFDAFVVLMSEPPRAGRAEDERERVTKAFIDQDIVHVSTLFEADVLGRERRLPWRVERALSRLGRDLSMLPLYRRASPGQIREIKIQIINDVIRPVRTPQHLTDLLVNCDVLAKDIVVLQESQIEHEIIVQLPAGLLLATTWQVLNNLEQLMAREGDEPQELATRHRVLARDMLGALVRTDADVDGELLEAMVKREVFSAEEFSGDLREKLRQQQVVQAFLTGFEDYLGGLGRFPAGKVGGRLAEVVRLVFPELLRRGHHAEAARTFDALHSGDHDSEAAEVVHGLIELCRQSLAEEQNVGRLLEALSDEQLEKEKRDVLVTLLSISGAAAAKGLKEVYAAAASVSIRASAFDVMKRIGAPALVPFLAELTNIEQEWPAIHHVLVALEDQSDPALADSIKPFLKHENARVRQAALKRVFELLGPDSKDRLIVALSDPDAGTRQAAVAYLGELRSRDPKVLAFYTRALLPDDVANAEREPEEVLVEICRSLSAVGKAPFETGASAEQILFDALRQEGKGKRISGMFHKRPLYHAERVRVAICEALGVVGTPETAKAMRELVSGETGGVPDAVAAAAERIEQRGA
jgi:HEAT repeat protein